VLRSRWCWIGNRPATAGTQPAGPDHASYAPCQALRGRSGFGFIECRIFRGREYADTCPFAGEVRPDPIPLAPVDIRLSENYRPEPFGRDGLHQNPSCKFKDRRCRREFSRLPPAASDSDGIYMTAAGILSGNSTYWLRAFPTGRHAPQRYRWLRKHVQISMVRPLVPRLYVLRLSRGFALRRPQTARARLSFQNRF